MKKDPFRVQKCLEHSRVGYRGLHQVVVIKIGDGRGTFRNRGVVGNRDNDRTGGFHSEAK